MVLTALCLLQFSLWDFAPRAPSSRPCFSCNKQPAGVLEHSKTRADAAPEQVLGVDLLERALVSGFHSADWHSRLLFQWIGLLISVPLVL
jgi:hypothetical protein